MATEATVKVSVRPWVIWYLKCLVCFCWIFGTTPDMQKVKRMILRGIVVTPE